MVAASSGMPLLLEALEICMRHVASEAKAAQQPSQVSNKNAWSLQARSTRLSVATHSVVSYDIPDAFEHGRFPHFASCHDTCMVHGLVLV